MKETEQHKNEANSRQALFPSNKITLEGYCVIKVGDTLPVDQCRRIIVFETKGECEKYQSRATGVGSKIISIKELSEMPEEALKATLGLHIPAAFDQEARTLNTEALKDLMANRSAVGIHSKCGDLAALFEVANELGVLFAGLPVSSDEVYDDEKWRRPKFSDAGDTCEFPPEFWNSPNPSFVFEGVYIPAPGNYTIGEWTYVSNQCPPDAEGKEEAVNAPNDAKPIAENNDEAEEAESDDEDGDEDGDDNEDGDDEYYDEDEPSEMQRLTLDEIQSDETSGDDLPFSSSLEDDIEVQAVCRRTPRTSTMMTILEGLELTSADG
jgi:hypothetical protein